jgi:hypothetical protein
MLKPYGQLLKRGSNRPEPEDYAATSKDQSEGRADPQGSINGRQAIDIAAIRIACQPVEGPVRPLSTKRADESVIASMSVSPETIATA